VRREVKERLVAQRVHRGALLLDSLAPDWAARVDVNEIRMADCSRCVLGQLFGNYVVALIKFWNGTGRVAVDQASSHGFAFEWGFLESAEDEALTDAWIAEIEQRLPRPASPTRPKRTVAVAVPMLCTV
jgi:hypothetical protein